MSTGLELREPHEPPRAGRDPALPGRLQRDRDPVPLRRHAVREQRWASWPATTSSPITEGSEQLRELGRTVLWEGALDIVFDREVATARSGARTGSGCARMPAWAALHAVARGESVVRVQTSPATVAAILLLVAAASLIVLAAIAVRPHPRARSSRRTAAPGDAAARARTRPPPRGAHRRRGRRAKDRPARGAQHPRAGRRARDAPPEQAAAPQQEAAGHPAPAAAPRRSSRPTTARWTPRRFDAAWTMLSPAVRAAFGGFEQWRDGYATTLLEPPARHRGQRATGAVATVAHELVTEDRSPCGPVRRPSPSAGGWSLDAAAAGAPRA